MCNVNYFVEGRQISTFHFNLRCKPNDLKDTSGPGIHQRTHLGAPFSLKTTWTSTTSGFKDARVLFNDIVDQFNDIIDQLNDIIDQARSIFLLLAWLRL